MYLWIVVVGGFFAFFAASGIGANDAANAFATSVGSKALTLKQKFFLVPKLITKKININFDNISSSTYTVLEVITNDRPGLLFDISKVLLKHKLVISMAKISTNGDFVEDSFHIRNEFGLKIDKDDSMKSIKKEIHVVLEKGLNNAS